MKWKLFFILSTSVLLSFRAEAESRCRLHLATEREIEIGIPTYSGETNWVKKGQTLANSLFHNESSYLHLTQFEISQLIEKITQEIQGHEREQGSYYFNIEVKYSERDRPLGLFGQRWNTDEYGATHRLLQRIITDSTRQLNNAAKNLGSTLKYYPETAFLRYFYDNTPSELGFHEDTVPTSVIVLRGESVVFKDFGDVGKSVTFGTDISHKRGAAKAGRLVLFIQYANE